ncbi:MAG: hypothetical protein PHV59_02105 [Victivallales bacterium]|nr:hypothetical protein [Victivallales bacterium]
MKPEVRYFDVYPKVFPVGREAEINIRPLFGHARFSEAGALKVESLCCNSMLPDGTYSPVENLAETPFQLENGILAVKLFFPGESEYCVRVSERRDGNFTVIGDFRVYALAGDLFALRPFKGDFHMHSNRSDGHDAPDYVAASCRKVGFDFMALTDHHRYEPSLEVCSAMAELNTGLICYPGEEVHSPDNNVHIVNFGGKFSVNKLFQENEAQYRRDVAERMAAMPEVPESIRFTIAASEWCYDKVWESGGLGIFCHPYWMPLQRYHLSEELITWMFRRQKFAAFELLGGFPKTQLESNNLQVARYNEERAAGKKIPIVGASDCHFCDRDLLGWYYTVVLAHSADLEDLKNGVGQLNSVAVEQVEGESCRVYGPFRLVRYVRFLLREFFPAHDAACREEGLLMLEALSGRSEAAERLRPLKKRTLEMLDKYWFVQ